MAAFLRIEAGARGGARVTVEKPYVVSNHHLDARESPQVRYGDPGGHGGETYAVLGLAEVV